MCVLYTVCTAWSTSEVAVTVLATVLVTLTTTVPRFLLAGAAKAKDPTEIRERRENFIMRDWS